MSGAGIVMEWTGLGLMSVGVFFFIAAAVGVLRMPDAFSRGHTGGKADGPGFMFCMLGAWFIWVRINPVQSIRLPLLLIFMFASNPIVIHTILRYSWSAGVGMMPATKILLIESGSSEKQGETTPGAG